MTKRKAEPSTALSEYTPSPHEEAALATPSEHTLTPHEEAALATYSARRAADRVPRVKIVKENKASHITLDHPHAATGYALLAEALGVHDTDFLIGLVIQLGNAASQPQLNEYETNFMLSIIKGIEPRDRFEVMLAAQIAAVHLAMMRTAGRLANAAMIPQLDSAERALNKLARTYAILMEAFKRYRTGGQQNVIVQHVSVSQGGQAVVGNVTQGSGERARDKAVPSPPALADSPTPAMTVVGEPAPAAIPLKRKSSKRAAITLARLPRCWPARAAGPEPARARPAGRRRYKARSVVACMAAHRDQVRRKEIRTRSSMVDIRKQRLPSGDKFGRNTAVAEAAAEHQMICCRNSILISAHACRERARRNPGKRRPGLQEFDGTAAATDYLDL